MASELSGWEQSFRWLITDQSLTLTELADAALEDLTEYVEAKGCRLQEQPKFHRAGHYLQAWAMYEPTN